MIKLIIDGEETQYTELKVNKNIDDLAGSFSAKTLKPFSPGSKIEIKINLSLIHI